MTTAVARSTEGKYRTSADIKERATEIYARWGLSLSDAINVFLVKSVDVGGLPFSMTPSIPTFDAIAKLAHKAPLNADGVAVLPSSWADDDA